MTTTGINGALGCWAVVWHDMCAVVESVHAHEIDALRAALASDMHAQVVWMPWGVRLDDAMKATEAAKKAPGPWTGTLVAGVITTNSSGAIEMDTGLPPVRAHKAGCTCTTGADDCFNPGGN